MSKKIQNDIQERIELITKLSEQLEKKIASYDQGSLHCRIVGEKAYYYYSDSSSKECLLGKKDDKLIKELLQKSYYEKVLKSINSELIFLKRMQTRYPRNLAEDTYDLLRNNRKYGVKPITPTDEQFITNWQNQPYTPKPFKKEDPFFVTLRGERVRSKSEVIIADRLLANGVPYKYECPILVGNEIIHPDFSILRIRDRKILYLEHNGKVGDQQYADDMVDRINKYEAAGIHQGDRLFLTYETANRPLDVRVLDIMINDLFK